MVFDIFNRRKKAVLSKKDKSSKGDWDEKIKGLCDKINLLEDYCTTSSCSGRILVMKDEDKKGSNLFLAVWHVLIDLEKFLKSLPKEKAGLNLKFKQESPILHVACRDLDSAFKLLDKAQKVGWKRSGLIGDGKNHYIVELVSTEKLEFPLTKNGRMLVDEEFLKIVLEKANENLKKSWEKINKLKNSL